MYLRSPSASGRRVGLPPPCCSPCSSPTSSSSPPSSRSLPWLDFPLKSRFCLAEKSAEIYFKVNLALLLRFFPQPTIALIRALEGHFFQVTKTTNPSHKNVLFPKKIIKYFSHFSPFPHRLLLLLLHCCLWLETSLSSAMDRTSDEKDTEKYCL